MPTLIVPIVHHNDFSTRFRFCNSNHDAKLKLHFLAAKKILESCCNDVCAYKSYKFHKSNFSIIFVVKSFRNKRKTNPGSGRFKLFPTTFQLVPITILRFAAITFVFWSFTNLVRKRSQILLSWIHFSHHRKRTMTPIEFARVIIIQYCPLIQNSLPTIITKI